MADDTSNKPYPFQFDPSQWSNPYSKFYGKALPWPSSYAGTPNDALGQPIQPPPGMTLNQTPQQPQQAPAAPGSPLLYGPGGAVNPNNSIGAQQRGNIPMPGGQFMSQPGYQMLYGGGQGQPAAPAAAPAAAPPNNWQNTLSMLANPGHVTTPGATVPQAAAQGGGQPSPGVLQNFLANWQPAQSGPGSGFTQNFNTILRGLQAQRGS
jgi:hypothetical protein